MRQLAVLLSLAFAVLLFSAGESFALPPCPPGDYEYWHNCFGTFTTADGDKYVGEFRNNEYHGHGTYYFLADNEFKGVKYVGEFRDDLPNGRGTQTYADGDKYVGEFRDGNFHGHGTYYFLADNEFKGDKYAGEYRDDEYHGQGTYTFADGEVWEGIWENGEFQYARKGSPPVIAENPPSLDSSRGSDPDKNEETIAAASGTGFVVSKSGHIITNNHVINGCQEVKVHTKGDVYKAKILRRDTVNDLAVIKVNFQPSWVFAMSGENAGLMQEIYVAGYPFGERVSSSVKITRGIVSSLSGIGDNFSQVQIDAALQPGNSGGPIINENGDVVGVAVAKLDLKVVLEEYGVVPEGTNFGIKSSVVRNFLEANGVKLRKPSGSKVSLKELGQHITDGTLFLTCWMTYAQIEKLRTEKVMFKDLQ